VKRIITIETLFERAMRQAQSKQDRMGYAAVKRRGHPVYEVFIYLNRSHAILKHYGTITVHYDMSNAELIQWYGEGVSDRDSMNTFLSCLRDEEHYFRYGPRMGFIMERGGITYAV
jgi:hypothetical protein